MTISSRRSVFWVFFGLAALHGGSLRGLTITELMYHPAEVDQRRFEYIEVFNENPDPLDLSEFTVCTGVELSIPAGTWIDGRAYLVICADAAAIEAKYGITNTVGDWPYAGALGVSLDNGGELIEICNPGGRVVAAVSYNDSGKWPAGADGTGHSLELVDPYRDMDDPDNWMLSNDLEGSPGLQNPCASVPGGASSGGGGGPVGLFTEHVDAGFPCGTGDTTFTALGSVYTQTGAGNDIWAGGDQFQFAYVRIDGNFNIQARMASRSWFAGQQWGKGGLMCRQDLSASARYVFTHDNPDPDGARLARRPTHGGADNEEPSILANGTHPNWYRLQRSGNTITGFWSNNGSAWTAFSATTTWTGGNVVYLGMALTSHAGCGSSTLTWDSLQITGTVLPPEGGGGPGPMPGVCSPRASVLINEGLLRSAGTRWIELFNAGSTAVNLTGHFLTDDRNNLTKAPVPAGTMVPPLGFVSFTDTQLGLDFSISAPRPSVLVALVEPGGGRVLDAVNFSPEVDEMSEARVPDGDGELTDAAEPTRGAANRVDVETDVVINEILYQTIDDDRDKEFIELYNRGSQAVDLTGWSFSNGVTFAFPDNQVIAAGGYLVVARDPDRIAQIYSLSPSIVIGPLTPQALLDFGQLRDGGERLTLSDPLGRTADTVRYHDGGDWARWADGGGSSLELIDASQDNRRGVAWDASDDSGKASAQTYSYVARYGGEDSELAVLLLSGGITVVDDISIIGGGVTNNDTDLIGASEVWRYFKGTVAPPGTWSQLGFADGSWLTGATGIGYGDADDATTLTDMMNGYMTIFCRKTFNVADVSAIDRLVLSITVDDGFYAYLNGVEVSSSNVAGAAFDAASPVAIEPTLVEQDITSFKSLLVNGTNVLAVQVHNAGLGSSDLSFIPRLIDRTTTVTGGSERIVNGTFDANATGWIIEGTHVRSGRTTVGAIRGAGSLRVLASGRGDNKVNRIETADTGIQPLSTAEDLLISFKARWVVGSQSLLTHGYKHSIAKSHPLDVPENLGTPGARNSVTQRQIGATGGNLGPVIWDLEQDPALPEGGEAVIVRCRVSDPDGVGTVRLSYALNNPSSTPTVLTMTPRGGGLYDTTIPGQALGTKVVFFITATDGGGRAGRYPIDITLRSHPMVLNPPAASLNEHRYIVYGHDARNAGTTYHDYRFYMTQTNETELTNRRRLSNDLVDGSFVFGGSTIYHESKTRFSGSPWARAGFSGSFRVRMPGDRALHDRYKKFNLEDHHGNGGDARERIGHYLIRNNQGAITVPYSETQTMSRWKVNNVVTAVREHVWVPDKEYIELWFDDDSGDFLEMDDRFVINDNGDRIGSADGRLLYPPPSERGDANGDNKENYRWFFGLRAKEGADDFRSFIDLARLMDSGDTSDAAFDSTVFDIVNVEEFLRIWAVRWNISDWDEWGAERGKNCYLYKEGVAGRWHLLAWDMELTYETGRLDSFLIPTTPSSAFNPGGFGEVNRMLNRTKIKRMYYGILDEMVNGPFAWFTSSYLTDYMGRLASLGMANTNVGLAGQYIDQRRDRIRTRVASAVFPGVRLVITTNGGNNFSTPNFTVNIAGNGPANVCSIFVNGLEYATLFPTMSTWEVRDIDLVPGANVLGFVGFNLRGDAVDTDTITVTNTSGPLPPPAISSINPATAVAGADIQLNGTDFLNGLRVFFAAVESTRVVFDRAVNPSLITARVPAGAGSVQVTVRNPDLQVSNGRTFTYTVPPANFVRGDVNGDGAVDISDPVRLLLHLFSSVAIDCQDAADTDDNEVLNLTDAVRTLNFLYRSGPAPLAPFPIPGPDPLGSAIGCSR